MKKTQAKRQRTPKRGPGVAELEKILKEQQEGGQDSGTNQPPSPSPPPSWPHLLPLLPNLELLSGGPEKALFPTTPLLGENTKSSLAVPPDFFPNFHSSSSTLDFYNSLVNNSYVIPGSASATSSAATARLFHQIEHPSSQRSTHFNNLWTSPSPEEQEKIVSAKRARALGEERQERRGGMLTNMTRNMKESSSSSSSSLEVNRTTAPFNFDPNFRVTKRGFGGQLMSSTRSSQQAQEVTNFMPLCPPSSSSAPNEFAEFNFRLPQEIMEGSQKRGGGGSGAVGYNKITFNSSLYESKSKSKGAAIGSSYNGAAEAGAGAEAEAERDGVDLDLKL